MEKFQNGVICTSTVLPAMCLWLLSHYPSLHPKLIEYHALRPKLKLYFWVRAQEIHIPPILIFSPPRTRDGQHSCGCIPSWNGPTKMFGSILISCHTVLYMIRCDHMRVNRVWAKKNNASSGPLTFISMHTIIYHLTHTHRFIHLFTHSLIFCISPAHICSLTRKIIQILQGYTSLGSTKDTLRNRMLLDEVSGHYLWVGSVREACSRTS